MIGEIGGTAEEEAAAFITASLQEAGRRLHRRPDGAARAPHGPRRRDHRRRQGHGRREDGGARRAAGRARREEPGRHRRAPSRTCSSARAAAIAVLYCPGMAGAVVRVAAARYTPGNGLADVTACILCSSSAAVPSRRPQPVSHARRQRLQHPGRHRQRLRQPDRQPRAAALDLPDGRARSRARTCSRRTSPGCPPGSRSARASDGYIARKKEIDFLVAMNPETAREDVLALDAGRARSSTTSR